jgi:hypothetical protein
MRACEKAGIDLVTWRHPLSVFLIPNVAFSFWGIIGPLYYTLDIAIICLCWRGAGPPPNSGWLLENHHLTTLRIALSFRTAPFLRFWLTQPVAEDVPVPRVLITYFESFVLFHFVLFHFLFLADLWRTNVWHSG